MIGVSYIQYTNGGEAYVIKRVIPEAQLKNPDMKILKQWFHCDTVLRAEGNFYFCNKIEEAKIID